MTQRNGYSLAELAVVLLLLAILYGLFMPPVARWRDRLAVCAARDEVAAVLAWTRLAAAAHGGATLVLDPASGEAGVRLDDGDSAAVVRVRDRYGVTIDAGEPVAVRYDALGIGRFASRTLRFRRGDAVHGLTISAYGRVRRW